MYGLQYMNKEITWALVLVLGLVPVLAQRQAGKFSSECRTGDLKCKLYRPSGLNSTNIHHCCCCSIGIGSMAVVWTEAFVWSEHFCVPWPCS